MGRFFARATRGIEWIAAAEITGRGGGTVHDLDHREVHFSAPSPGPLVALRTVDDVFAWAGRVGGMGRERSSLAALARLPEPDVASAVAEVAALRPVADGARFDVTASFLGRRNYNRYDLEDAAGEALAHATGGEYVSRRAESGPAAGVAARSWRVHVRDGEALLGLRLAARPLHRRAAGWATVPGSLHPPVAAALVLLAGVVPGQWLGDPFCGSGTILAEYLHLTATGRAAGIDASAEAVASAHATAEAAAWRCTGDSLGRAGRLVVLAEPPRPAPPPGWAGPVLSFGPLSVSGSKPLVLVFTRPGDPGGGLPLPGALLAPELARFAHHARG
jgi:23S rRNA G2445 N2-methylase RlmL